MAASRLTASLLCAGLLALSVTRASPVRARPVVPLAGVRQVHAAVLLSRLPLAFEANRGQAPPVVRFLARSAGTTVFITTYGVSVLHNDRLVSGTGDRPASLPMSVEPPAPVTMTAGVRFAGGHAGARAMGLERLPGTVSYFLGRDATRWHTGIPTFRTVRVRDLYRGIDVVYSGVRDGTGPPGLECDLVIHPGADPRAIHMAVPGGASARKPAGRFTSRRIVLSLAGLPRATAWHDAQHGHRIVTGNVLRSDSSVGLHPTQNSRRQPLSVDPAVHYSSYLGGTGVDLSYGVATDKAGDILVVGTTNSLHFPTRQAYQGQRAGTGGQTDVFVARLSPSGQTLLDSTYLGGSDYDQGYGIAVDAVGAVYITGETGSRDFPLVRPFQSVYGGGGSDGFLAKLSSHGDRLIYSSYVGGEGGDFAAAVAVTPAGTASIAGYTRSLKFPTLHPIQRAGVGSDAFITQVDVKGSVTYSTYLGATGVTYASSIALDRSGDLYITGTTGARDFPAGTVLGSQAQGPMRVFVVRIHAGGAIVYSTLLGGTENSFGVGIAVDSTGSAYITGQTAANDFPVMHAAQARYGGNSTEYFSGDAFVSRLDPTGSRLLFSTFLGGRRDERGRAIAVDAVGDVYVTGSTDSASFPTTRNAPQRRFKGATCADTHGTFPCTDAFIGEWNANGQLLFSTFQGGTKNDAGTGVVVSPTGRVYVVGDTSSTDFPMSHPWQPTNHSRHGGGESVFVMSLNGAGR